MAQITGGPHRGHAAGDTDVEKQASQLASDTKYKVSEINAIFNQVTLECFEFLSLGVYIDFNLVKKSETSTEVTIEIRRKMGSFDTEVEVSKANYHFKDLVNHLSEVIVLSEAKTPKLSVNVTPSFLPIVKL